MCLGWVCLEWECVGWMCVWDAFVGGVGGYICVYQLKGVDVLNYAMCTLIHSILQC